MNNGDILRIKGLAHLKKQIVFVSFVLQFGYVVTGFTEDSTFRLKSLIFRRGCRHGNFGVLTVRYDTAETHDPQIDFVSPPPFDLIVRGASSFIAR